MVTSCQVHLKVWDHDSNLQRCISLVEPSVGTSTTERRRLIAYSAMLTIKKKKGANHEAFLYKTSMAQPHPKKTSP
jgi:hypothetical protein